VGFVKSTDYPTKSVHLRMHQTMIVQDATLGWGGVSGLGSLRKVGTCKARQFRMHIVTLPNFRWFAPPNLGLQFFDLSEFEGMFKRSNF
jgi:hypothetical protein